ncbi:MAG: enoyl-[acyl-carrier-protein] reductase [Rhodospirillales bacterium 20-60-12]|nr:MAG: enoyl-[acyl-carrier-protein] reductase [Rhodospirillales bacterium 20-60-12]HQT68199.1 enoyl-ACP reductase FabI [Acetobacteraceae bacterium]
MSIEQAASPQFNLKGKRGLILGIANDHSIAAGCARQFAAQGAILAATYLNATAKPFVSAVTDALPCPILLACNVLDPGALEAVFADITKNWGSLDFVLHSIAFAPKNDLHGRVTDCSAAGFATAMDVSCHSFIRAAKLAEPLMKQGGTLLAVSFYGSAHVVAHYNIMGPVKAALESSVRYLAAELGPQQIRVHALSPGPIATRAARGIDRFDELLADAAIQAPEHQLVTIDDVGAVAAFLVSDAARHMTGTIIPIDAGQQVVA